MSKYVQGVKVERNWPAFSSVSIGIIGILLSFVGIIFNVPALFVVAITISLFGIILAVLSLRL